MEYLSFLQSFDCASTYVRWRYFYYMLIERMSVAFISFIVRSKKHLVQYTSVKIYPDKIFDYFGGIINSVKLRDLYSYSVTTALFYIKNIIEKRSENYICHCFKCIMFRELMEELDSRGYKNLLLFEKGSGVVNIFM